MEVIPIWQIYSYWVFAMTLLWLSGNLPFSPLFSAALALAASITLSVKIKAPFYLFIVFMHVLSVWLLRNGAIQVVPNVLVFLVYNLTLLTQSTNFKKVYENIFKNPPRTVQEYIQRRGFSLAKTGV
jgi:hypothetical protein